jgi:hypothetical protein
VSPRDVDRRPASGRLPLVVGRVRLARGFALGVLLLVSPARAGRTSHLWLDEAQLVPEGGIELEQWVWAYGRVPNKIDRPASIWVWWGPVVSMSNHLELALPLQLASFPGDLYLHSISLSARYRFVPREQDEGWQPMLRLTYQQPLDRAAGPPGLEAALVLAVGSLRTVLVTFNAGVFVGMPFLQSNLPGSTSVLGQGGVGVSFPVGRELRLAAEAYGNLPITGDTRPNVGQVYLGPSLAWTRGPFWITFGCLFGLTSDSSRYYPRVLWGIAL